METKKMYKVISLYFNLSLTDNYSFLGNFKTKKAAVKYMKKLTKKYNYRDRKDPWNTPLENYEDYCFIKTYIPKKQYKKN